MLSKLVALPYSPWSIKAKWALDHHGLPYRFVTHLPMLGEPLLRARAGKIGGRVSVPLLVTDGGAIGDSWEIARWAERQGGAPDLFPEEKIDEIRAWNERSELMLASGRALSLVRMLRSPAALAENVPGPRVGNLLAPIGALGVRFVQTKYGAQKNEDALRDELRIGLAALAEAIEGRDYLVGESLTYADIAMTVATFFVKPAGEGIDHLGEATRECWTDRELAEEYAPVIAWRDRILARLPGR